MPKINKKNKNHTIQYLIDFHLIRETSLKEIRNKYHDEGNTFAVHCTTARLKEVKRTLKELILVKTQ